MLGRAIRVVRRGNIIGGEGQPKFREFTVDLDGVQVDKATYTSCCSPASEVGCAFDVHLAKLSQWLRSLVVHDVNASGQMHDLTHAFQGHRPVGFCRKASHLDNLNTIR